MLDLRIGFFYLRRNKNSSTARYFYDVEIISTIVDAFLSQLCQFFSCSAPLHSLAVMSKYRICLKHCFVYQPNLISHCVCLYGNKHNRPSPHFCLAGKHVGRGTKCIMVYRADIYSINKKSNYFIYFQT